MHGYYFHGFSGGYMGILALILVIAIVVFFIKFNSAQNTHHEGDSYYKRTLREDRKERENALGILRERYAKGEISKEEFEQMKKDIIKD